MYALLRQRHIKEAVHLEGQLDKERGARLAEARAEVVENRAGEREKLQAAFDQVRSRHRWWLLCSLSIHSTMSQNLFVEKASHSYL